MNNFKRKFIVFIIIAILVFSMISNSVYGYSFWILITGTPYDDDLKGTTAGDVIKGLEGNDRIMALTGDDILYGGEGNDHLEPNQGNDIVYGGAGNDLLNSYSGMDTLYGEAGDDNFTIHPTVHKTLIKPDNEGLNTITINYVFDVPIGKFIGNSLTFEYLSYDKTGLTSVYIEDYKIKGTYKIVYRKVTYS